MIPSGSTDAGTEVARRPGRRWRTALVIAWIAAGAGPGIHAAGVVRAQDAAAKPARTVWDGVYTDEQATRGQTQYLRACASCHAPDLRGGSTAPSLVEESFAFQWADTTVGELFERIRMLMPSDRPNSLSSQAYRDVVAFILQANKFPVGEKELDAEVEGLRQILIPATKR